MREVKWLTWNRRFIHIGCPCPNQTQTMLIGAMRHSKRCYWCDESVHDEDLIIVRGLTNRSLDDR